MNTGIDKVVSFVKANLGKKVTIDGNEATIVGYNEVLCCPIVSFTEEYYYWRKPIKSDIILLDSPSNVSFSLIGIGSLKKLLDEE